MTKKSKSQSRRLRVSDYANEKGLTRQAVYYQINQKKIKSEVDPDTGIRLILL